jgi:hypothetical protein
MARPTWLQIGRPCGLCKRVIHSDDDVTVVAPLLMHTECYESGVPAKDGES